MSATRPPRRKDDVLADPKDFEFAHAALTATAEIQSYKVPAGREFKLERVTYYSTGLAADNTNAFRGEVLKNGATVAALIFNTDGNDDPAGAALAAGWTEATLSSTDANLWFAEGDVLSVKFTEDGDATLPAGNGVLEGRLF